ncbi:ABC transporter permease [uncultured Sphingomonas sp.]|uniref:ABC transporter permease n=1 Tax=uncultured Sphingomonas sp. TaxID=158754 RepID=UPI0035C9AECA
MDLAVVLLPGASTGLALLLTLCPLVAVSLEAFRRTTPDGSVWTPDNFGLLATSTELLAALGRSATLALFVGTLAMAFGFALSLTTWHPARARRILLAMAVLALLPGEVFSLGLLQVAKLAGVEEGAPFLAGIAQLVWVVPFTTGSLMLANASIGRSVIEGAFELGRTPSSVAMHVVRWINWGAITASGILSFTLSLNENTRASYLGGSQPALANEVFGRLQAGLLPENREIFAVELLLVLTALTSAFLILNVLSRASRTPGA